MKKAVTAEPGDPILTLDCPYCTASVELTRARLIDGQAVQCPQCREQAFLSMEGEGHSSRTGWTLVELDFDDERR